MNHDQRKRYHAHLWPAACAGQGWKRSDETKRRAVTLECMRLINAPLHESTTDLTQDQVTALFCYLRHLAAPGGLNESARWLDCQEDYVAFNRASQADWHEAKTYGPGKNKLDRDRFAGAQSAVGEPLEAFNPEEIRKRHLTMAARHRAKDRKDAATDKDLPGLVAPKETTKAAAHVPPRAAAPVVNEFAYAPGENPLE